MANDNKIKSIIGSDSGMRVPDDYFDTLFKDVMANLPERQQQPAVKVSTWQKVRPYLYLAAMFAGIWCMMKMFHMMSTDQAISLDNPPTELVAQLQDSDFDFDDMVSDYSESDYDLESDISESYDSFDEISKDFNYQLKPQYQNMDTEVAEPRKSQNKKPVKL